MKRLAIPEDMKKEIIREIRRSNESRYDHRLHRILLVANVMGESPRSV